MGPERSLIISTVIIPAVMGVVSAVMPFYREKYSGLFVVAALSFSIYGTRRAVMETDGLALLMSVLSAVMLLVVLFFIVLGKNRYSRLYWAAFCIMIASVNGFFFLDRLYLNITCWLIANAAFLYMGLASSSKRQRLLKEYLLPYVIDSIFLTAGLIVLKSGTVPRLLNGFRLGFGIGWFSFILLLSAAMVKAGMPPFHSRYFKAVSDGRTVITIPAVMTERMLGFYLAARLMIYWIEPGSAVTLLIILLGSIIAAGAVLNALKTDSVAAAMGYGLLFMSGTFLLGLSLYNPAGRISVVVQIINFGVTMPLLLMAVHILCSGAGTDLMKNMGGIAVRMPVVFYGTLVGLLSVGGFPFLAGFISQWHQYQSAMISIAAGAQWRIFPAVLLFGCTVIFTGAVVRIVMYVFTGTSRTFGMRRISRLRLIPFIIPVLLLFFAGLFPGMAVYPAVTDITGSPILPGLWDPAVTAGIFMFFAGFLIILYILRRVDRYRVSEPFNRGRTLTESETQEFSDFSSYFKNWKAVGIISAFSEKDGGLAMEKLFLRATDYVGEKYRKILIYISGVIRK